MKNKNIIILTLVFAVLVGFLVVKTYLPRFLSKPSAYMQKTSSLDKTSVQSLTIKDKTATISIVKENSVWKINGKKADSDKVDNLINQLLTPDSPELIAQTDKRHKEFELTDDTATKITLDDKLTWLVGKSSGTGVYARFEGENDVYIIKDIWRTSLPSVSDWYDKTILEFDQTKLTKISFTQNGKTTVIVKKDEKWVDTNGKEVKKDKVESLLPQLSNLTAHSLFDAEKKIDYPKTPTLTVTVEYDGKSETLEFYKGSSDYLIKRMSDKEQFIASEYSILSIVSAPKDLYSQ